MSFDSFIQLLGKEYSPEILQATATPISAAELSTKLDIPIATCYRRLDELTEANLVKAIEPPESAETQQSTLYQRSIETLRFSFDTETVEIRNRTE